MARGCEARRGCRAARRLAKRFLRCAAEAPRKSSFFYGVFLGEGAESGRIFLVTRSGNRQSRHACTMEKRELKRDWTELKT
jgi:hypothetical protein